MDTTPLQLIAEFNAKADVADRVEQLVVQVVEKTRAEEGCEKVSFYRVNEDSEKFVFFAEFANEEALRAHLASAWRQDIIVAIADLLTGTPRRFTMQRVA